MKHTLDVLSSVLFLLGGLCLSAATAVNLFNLLRAH